MRYYSSTAQAATLTADLSAGATSMTVSGTSGFPASHPFTLVIDPGTGTEEIVDVTASSGTTLTITRGRDGTTAQEHVTGAQVRHMVTARDLREAQEHINATSNVHGVTGTIVTTTGTQTLTNKTIDGAENTLTNIPQSAIQGFNDLTISAVPSGVVTAFAGTAAPDGWLLCDGSAVSRTTYSALFAAIGTAYGPGDGANTFNLPNLRGRVPVGLDAGQSDFSNVGKTGGAKTHTLSHAEMPSHTHGMNHTHTMSHNHSMSHTHGGYTDTNSHSHSATTSTNYHNHSGTTDSSIVPADFSSSTYTGSGTRVMPGRHDSGRFSGNIQGSSHAHSFTTSSSGHSHSVSVGSSSHSHSVTTNSQSTTTTGTASGGTGGASSTITGSAGSGAAHNNLQPYMTLNYIIKA